MTSGRSCLPSFFKLISKLRKDSLWETGAVCPPFTISNTLSVFKAAEQAFCYVDQMAPRGLEDVLTDTRRISNKSIFYGV